MTPQENFSVSITLGRVDRWLASNARPGVRNVDLGDLLRVALKAVWDRACSMLAEAMTTKIFERVLAAGRARHAVLSQLVVTNDPNIMFAWTPFALRSVTRAELLAAMRFVLGELFIVLTRLTGGAFEGALQRELDATNIPRVDMTVWRHAECSPNVTNQRGKQ